MSQKRKPPRRLTEEDLNFIKEAYKFLTDQEIAKILGCNIFTVRHKRVEMGLNKDDLSPWMILKEAPIFIIRERKKFNEEDIETTMQDM